MSSITDQRQRRSGWGSELPKEERRGLPRKGRRGLPRKGRGGWDPDNLPRKGRGGWDPDNLPRKGRGGWDPDKPWGTRGSSYDWYLPLCCCWILRW